MELKEQDEQAWREAMEIEMLLMHITLFFLRVSFDQSWTTPSLHFHVRHKESYQIYRNYKIAFLDE